MLVEFGPCISNKNLPANFGAETGTRKNRHLIDDVLAEVPVGAAVSRKRGGLLPHRLPGHAEQVLVRVVKRPADLQHGHELAVGVEPGANVIILIILRFS
jgi:hypothetical protein